MNIKHIWAVLSFAVFIISSAALWYLLPSNHNDHYFGQGANTLTEAVHQFATSIDNSDYFSLKEILYFDPGVCGGIDLISVKTSDTDAIQLSVSDHMDISISSMTNRFSPLYWGKDFCNEYSSLWQQRIQPYRWAVLHYTPLLMAICLKYDTNADLVSINVPRLSYRDDLDIPFLKPEPEYNKIEFIRINNNWYFYNLSCHTAGLDCSREQILDHFQNNPMIGKQLLEKMIQNCNIFYLSNNPSSEAYEHEGAFN